eukprot:1188456-Amphidinium_carterae.1
MVSLLALARQFLAGRWCRGSADDITMFLHVSDRGMTYKFRQAVSTSLFQTAVECNDGHMESEIRALHHLHFSSSCGLHDAHNSLKWGLQTVCDDHLEQSKLLYSVIASIRPAATHALLYMPQWLDCVLEVIADKDCVSASTLYEVYGLLGVRADVLEVMTDEMRLCWDPQRCKLQVAESFMTRAASVSDLSYVLTLCWRFEQFCFSRWMTVGSATRALALGVATGFTHMYKCLRRDGSVSDHDGYAGDKLSEALVSLSLVLGLSCYPAESLIGMLLHDGRVLRRIDELNEVLHEESEVIENVSPQAWSFLAKFADVSSRRLRHMVVQCMSVSIAYVRHRFLSQFLDPPWTLLQGDVLQNLTSLQATDIPPLEKNTHKIWRLIRGGFCMGKLHRCLKLLTEGIFHSHFAERMHASAALLGRRHDYGASTLTARAFLHTLRSS